MVYTPQTWTDSPSTSTPISAARLTTVENGVRDAHLGAQGFVFSATPTWRSPYPQANEWTAGIENQKLTLWPVWIPRKLNIDGLGVHQNVGAVTGTVEIVIYTDNGSYFPGTLVKKTTPLALATAGIKSETFTAVTLEPGMYWWGYLPNFTVGTPDFQTALGAVSAQRNLLPWSTMPYGTGSTPTVNIGNDGAVAKMDSVTTAPATFAGFLESASNGPNRRGWIVARAAGV